MTVSRQCTETTTTGTTTTTCTTNIQNSQISIINLILSDINAVLPNFNTLVSSYRLLVGSAEEISRTPDVCRDVYIRSVKRFDDCGTLIDILLELLCCKIAFSAQFLQLTAGPVDLFRLLGNCNNECKDTGFTTAEDVLKLEVLRQALCKAGFISDCLPKDREVCNEPAPNVGPPPLQSDIADLLQVDVANNILNPTHPAPAPVTSSLSTRDNDATNNSTLCFEPNHTNLIHKPTVSSSPGDVYTEPFDSKVRRKHRKYARPNNK